MVIIARERSENMSHLFRVEQRNDASATGIFAREHHCRSHLLHGQIPYVPAQLPPTRGAARQLGPTIRADQVAGVALQYRRQNIVEADGTFEQAGQVAAGVGR